MLLRSLIQTVAAGSQHELPLRTAVTLLGQRVSMEFRMSENMSAVCSCVARWLKSSGMHLQCEWVVQLAGDCAYSLHTSYETLLLVTRCQSNRKARLRDWQRRWYFPIQCVWQKYLETAKREKAAAERAGKGQTIVNQGHQTTSWGKRFHNKSSEMRK